MNDDKINVCLHDQNSKFIKKGMNLLVNELLFGVNELKTSTSFRKLWYDDVNVHIHEWISI